MRKETQRQVQMLKQKNPITCKSNKSAESHYDKPKSKGKLRDKKRWFRM